MAKGTTPIAGCRREETVATICDLSIFGHGNVNSREISASASTTYPKKTHCNAILFLPLFLSSTEPMLIPIVQISSSWLPFASHCECALHQIPRSTLPTFKQQW